MMKTPFASPRTNNLRFGRRLALSLCALMAGASAVWQPSVHAAPAPDHGIVAANIDVYVNDFDNTTNSVVLTMPYAVGDFRIDPTGSNNGDYDTQIGPDRTNDVLDGIMMTSVRENGRDNENILYPGTNLCTSHIDYHKPGATNDAGDLVENSYWIPVALTYPNAFGTSVKEWDINVAAAWFPYDRWIGGFARNQTFANGGALNFFTGSPNLVLGTNFKDLGGGKAIVDLTNLGIDSRTDGVLLVMGAKNEDNYGLSQVNTTDGTWNLFSKDNGTDGSSTEQDPLAFVFIPKTDTNVISGRFLGNGTIDLYSGDSPQFTVTPLEAGRWELKIPGHSPRFGVLILSPEGGLPGNQDNIVTYQVNDAGDGWIVQSYDLPSQLNDFGAEPPFFPPPLETPGDGTEPVADFAFIPGATPGFIVTPTNGLATTENGDTATFTVALEAPPIADVTIGVSSSDTTEGTVSPASLTFTTNDWNQPQTVTITGVDDAEKDGSVAYNVMLAPAVSDDPEYAGVDPSDVSVHNADNESGGIIIAPTSGLTTTEAGGQSTFTVRLSTQPTDDVTISLSSSDTSEGMVSPVQLIFNSGNWDQEQTVTNTGMDDFVVDGNISYKIITAAAVSTDTNYAGLNPPDVSVVNLDNDTAGLDVSAGVLGLSVLEGQTVSYTVALTSQPGEDVTVNVVSGDTVQGGSVSPSTLTFDSSDWNHPQTVTITGADDLIADGDTAWAITNSASSSDSLYAALTPTAVPMMTLDNEPVVTLPSGEMIYGLGQTNIEIDAQAIVVDANAPSYDSATLTVTLTTNGTPDDRLEIRNTGTAAGEIGVAGNSVSYSGTDIATFAGGNGTTPLAITFNGAATPESAQALLRSVTFRNVSSSPSQNRRAVSFALAHGDGGMAVATTSIRVGLLHYADFQEGTDRGYGLYSGAADIELSQGNPDTAYSEGNTAGGLIIDWPDSGVLDAAQVLLRFDNIFGDEPGQIPTNAIIVSAQLMLHLPSEASNSRGDGSPLYRMLIPWNGDAETWNSLGEGVQQDDIESRSTFDSAFGTAGGGSDSGYGTIQFSVREDVFAWANGETNYGWVMPGWNGNTDGTEFRSSETPNLMDRPRLRVLWFPADSVTEVNFRQGVNGYTNAADTRIRQRAADADTDFSAQSSVFVDWAVDSGGENDEQVLMRFDNIIGGSSGQIPPGAHVDAAMLDLASVANNAQGAGGQFFAMLAPWQDTNTWNSLNNGIQTDGVEAAGSPTAVAGSADLDPRVQGGYHSFELTPDVQAWASGASPNYGWAILPWPNGSDGWAIETAESSDEPSRPRLRVYYDTNAISYAHIILQAPVASQSGVEIDFTGSSGSYTVWRAANAGGPWSSIGTTVVGADGKGTFTDNAPLEDAAFYRVSNP